MTAGEEEEEEVAKWFSDMSLSYEARVAVRGELASPKSFPQADTQQHGRQRLKRNTPDTRPHWDKEKRQPPECISPADGFCSCRIRGGKNDPPISFLLTW